MYTSGRTGTGHHAAPAQQDQLATAKSAAAELLRRNKSVEMRINARLEAAGSQLNASEWLLIHIGIVIVAGFVGTVIGGGSLLHRRAVPGRRSRAAVDVARLQAQPTPQELRQEPARHPAADGRVPDRWPVPGPVHRHHRQRGHRADRVRVPPGAGRDPPRRQPRDGARGRGRAVRQQGLRLGGDGHQHPASRRWQPGRAARHRGRHHPRARVHAPPGRGPRRGGQAVRLRARRPSAAVLHLPATSRSTTTSRPCGHGRWATSCWAAACASSPSAPSGCPGSSRWRSDP